MQCSSFYVLALEVVFSVAFLAIEGLVGINLLHGGTTVPTASLKGAVVGLYVWVRFPFWLGRILTNVLTNTALLAADSYGATDRLRLQDL